LGGGIICPVYKVKRFRCECVKDKGSDSGIRIIYGYKSDENKILFLELYHKNQKSNNDKERIYRYLSAA
jgi:mRNA-degrading endonuclease RelE of RelBE toxin-antitoxin system